MSNGSLDLLFTWSALINLQRCVGRCYVSNLAWRWSVQQLPKVVCPPFTLLLLVGEQFSTLGSDRSVGDLLAPVSVLACCFLHLFCETLYEVPSVFSNASFNLLVGFGVFGLSFCFPDSRFAMIQHLLRLFPDFNLVQCTHIYIGPMLFGLSSQRLLTRLPPCVFIPCHNWLTAVWSFPSLRCSSFSCRLANTWYYVRDEELEPVLCLLHLRHLDVLFVTCLLSAGSEVLQFQPASSHEKVI